MKMVSVKGLNIQIMLTTVWDFDPLMSHIPQRPPLPTPQVLLWVSHSSTSAVILCVCVDDEERETVLIQVH